MNDHSRLGGLDPLHLLRYATEVLPATRWAVGVVGLAAAAALVLALGQPPVFGVVSITGIFVAMVALFVLSRLLEMAAAATKRVAVVLMWFMVIVFMATVTATFTSVSSIVLGHFASVSLHRRSRHGLKAPVYQRWRQLSGDCRQLR